MDNVMLVIAFFLIFFIILGAAFEKSNERDREEEERKKLSRENNKKEQLRIQKEKDRVGELELVHYTVINFDTNNHILTEHEKELLNNDICYIITYKNHNKELGIYYQTMSIVPIIGDYIMNFSFEFKNLAIEKFISHIKYTIIFRDIFGDIIRKYDYLDETVCIGLSNLAAQYNISNDIYYLRFGHSICKGCEMIESDIDKICQDKTEVIIEKIMYTDNTIWINNK